MSAKTNRRNFIQRGMEGPPRSPENPTCTDCKGSGKDAKGNACGHCGGKGRIY